MVGYKRVVGQGHEDREMTHGEENINADEDEIGRLERNLVEKEIRRKYIEKDGSRLTRPATSPRIPEKL
jgi:hypothetical protein